MFLKNQDYSSDGEISVNVPIKYFVVGVGFAMALISTIQILLALRRKKKTKNELNKEAIK